MMKKFLIALCSLALMGSTFAQNHETKLSKKIDGKFLELPVKNGATKKHLELWVDGQKYRWMDIELDANQPDWYAYLPLEDFQGKSIDFKLISKDSQDPDIQGLKIVDQQREEMQTLLDPQRGGFHFSPKVGWNNDPNGMVYFQGKYHLFYQHNPYGVNWGNMHWGHATSNDLVNWQHEPVALYPDEQGTMFSGSAVVDVDNASGLGKNGGAPMVLFYTAAEKAWGQGLAYTQDGRTFEKLNYLVIPKITDGNRDPKIIWYEPAKHFVLVLYVTEEGNHHSMHFFKSTDLKNWTFTSKIIGGQGNDRYMFECPEFFELPVQGTTQKKWVLTGANSQYAIGTFDGERFTPEIERLFSQQGRDYYAAQTFNNAPEGRRIEIGWWRTNTSSNGSKFNQSFSIPMELTLRQTANGPRLFRQPVKELEKLRTKPQERKSEILHFDGENPLDNFHASTSEISFTLKSVKSRNIIISIKGLDLVYSPQEELLVIDGMRVHLPMKRNELKLHFFVDKTGLELFAGDGEYFIPFNYNFNPDNKSYAVKVLDGSMQLENLSFYELNNIWNK